MALHRSDAALILFTLPPHEEGRRKPLGLGVPHTAAAVYSEILRHLQSLCELPGVDLLVSSPGEPGPWARADGAHLAQRGRHFGESLRLAIEDAFALGYRRVVVIGNDAPEISQDYLRTAFASLEGDRAKAVLGPSTDGGYNLLGLTRACPAAFERMPWGSSRVGAETLSRLVNDGLSVTVLDALPDIDGPRDLGRFLRRAARKGSDSRLGRLASALRRWLVPQPSRYPNSARPLHAFSPATWSLLRAPPTPPVAS